MSRIPEAMALSLALSPAQFVSPFDADRFAVAQEAQRRPLLKGVS